MERLTNLEDIVSLFPGQHPCTAYLVDFSKTRAETCEEILVAVIESGRLFADPALSNRPIIPIVDASTIALESAKVLMEMRAGEIMSNRMWLLISRFQLPFWFVLMRQASEMMLAMADYLDGTRKSNQTITRGCASLIASIVKVTESWTERLRQEQISSLAGQQHDQASTGVSSASNENGVNGSSTTPFASGFAAENGGLDANATAFTFSSGSNSGASSIPPTTAFFPDDGIPQQQASGQGAIQNHLDGDMPVPFSQNETDAFITQLFGLQSFL